MPRPLSTPDLKQIDLPLHEPPEPERRPVGDERRELRDDRLIGRRDPEPGDPARVEIQCNGDRRSEQKRAGPAAHDPLDDDIDAEAQPAGPVERGDGAASSHRNRIDDEQVVEEPQVREWKCAGRRGRQVGRGRRQRAAERLRDSPHPDGRDRRKENDPPDDEGDEDPLQPVAQETARTLPVEHHAAEEAGYEEEERHPEDVRREQDDGDRRARRDVDHGPDSWKHARQEGEAGVKDDPEQQREAAHRVEGMEAIGGVHFFLLQLR